MCVLSSELCLSISVALGSQDSGDALVGEMAGMGLPVCNPGMLRVT